MKQEALALVTDISDPTQKLNLLREYLQAFILRSLHESEAFQCLSFVGDTALRFLHGLPRFSEDLDFSLENPKEYNPKDWVRKIKRDLTYAGFDVTVSWNDRKTVHSAWIRIAKIMKEVGLAAIPDQKISVKLEIDTCPPAGAILQNRVLNRTMIFALQHHDLSSLMAGKIHALITRKYFKGRDWYDLLWYRSQRPPVTPNLDLLKNALSQTERNTVWESREWSQALIEHVQSLDEKKLQEDVVPFLEHRQDAELLTKENITQAIHS